MADALLLLQVGSAARSSPLSSAAFPLPSSLSRHSHRFHRLPVGLAGRGRALVTHVKAHAVIAEKDESKWWEKNVGENMIDVNSPKELLDILSQAGDRLVIVEFYNTWCASCRGLFPKLCKIAQEHPEITVVKVKFDENKSMCKRLNVRVLPYFHFYHGAEGLVEFFSCSLVQFQKMKDAIALHNTASRVTGPPLGVGDLDLLHGPYPTVPRGNSR